MPAKSKAQQSFMGMVHAYKKGEVKGSEVSKDVKDAAKRMKKKTTKDYAKTKHKGLPNKVKKEALLRLIAKYGAKKVRETIMAVRPKSVTVSGNRMPEEPDFEYDPEKVTDEGFGGELKGKDKDKFEKARKENAEQLGYKATGTSDTKKQTLKMAHQLKETAKRDYKAEYKKFQSSTKSKKYRAELNQYNRKKGTYGNGDGKDASHKGGKIAGFEKESTNRGRAEKSRLKKETANEGSFKTTLRPQKKDINKMKVRFKSDPRRVYTLKSVKTGRVGGTSYMFAAPGNRKEHFTPKTWDLANKKGWLSLESVKEVSNPTSGIMTGAVQKFSSPEAKIHVDKDLGTMSKHLGKASQQVIKTMMNGVKSGKYDAMDLARGIQTGSIKITHFGERDFIQQLWNKVRDKFRRYSNRGKLR